MTIKSIQDCSKHQINKFSCGNYDLDEYLLKYATVNDENNIGKTFVLFDKNIILGFYTLANMHLDVRELSFEIRKNLPRYPAPSIRIARFAININYQHKGYGLKLIKDAFIRILSISKDTAIKFVVVDAKKESKEFYTKLSFVSLPKNELTLVLPIDIIKAAFLHNNK